MLEDEEGSILTNPSVIHSMPSQQLELEEGATLGGN
jgi:hypothetical protein